MSESVRLASAPLRLLRIGLVAALVITALDVAGMIAVGLPNAPVLVNAITTILALLTVVGSIGAWNGARWGVVLVVASRALAALSVVPLFLVPEAPAEALPMSAVLLVLAVAAIVAILIGSVRLRRR